MFMLRNAEITPHKRERSERVKMNFIRPVKDIEAMEIEV